MIEIGKITEQLTGRDALRDGDTIKTGVIERIQPQYADAWPAQLDSCVRDALVSVGILQPYQHQADAIVQSLDGGDVAPPETAQERPQGGWRLDYAADDASRPTGAQHVGVVNAVAARQRGCHQGKHLVSRIRPPRRICEVNAVVDEFTQTQVLDEGDPKEQPCIGHQAVVVEGDLDPVGMVKW